MSQVTITLTFASLAAAAAALDRLESAPQPMERIAFEDRPDVGVDTTVSSSNAAGIDGRDGHPGVEGVPADFNPFATGGAAVPVVPTAPTVASTQPTLAPPSVPPVLPAPVNTPPTAATVPTVVPAGDPSAPALPPALLTDATGLPWDARIHADSGKGKPKPTVADGTWRKKRGVDDATLAAVEAELRGALRIAAPAAVVPPPPATVPNPPPVLSAAALVPGGAAAAVVPTPPPAVETTAVPVPPPTTAASPVAPAAPAAETFGQFMTRIAPLIRANAAGDDITKAVLAPYGASAIGQLVTVWQTNPTLFAQIGNELTAALS
jgi:hypothetical protein